MLQLRRQFSSSIGGNDILRSILYHDKAVIVLNKPAGLIAQGGAHPTTSSGAYHLSQVLQELQSSLNLNQAPYPVHRLDKGTTGCLVLAKTPHAARELSKQFNRQDAAQHGHGLNVDKRYLALVQSVSLAALGGEIRTPLITDDGRMSAALTDEQRIAAAKAGRLKEAATDWKLLYTARTHGLSLLELHLLTGVKHQLRVHLAQCLGAPILGDPLYNQKSSKNPKGSDAPKQVLDSDLMFLHARELSFYRYLSTGSHRQVRVTVAAPLPPPFIAICKNVGMQIEEEWARGAVRIQANEVVQRRTSVEDMVRRLQGHVGEGMLCSYDLVD